MRGLRRSVSDKVSQAGDETFVSHLILGRSLPVVSDNPAIICASEPARTSCVRAEMTEDAEGRYFAGREASERALSRSAFDWRVAAAHAEMADRYEALAAVFGAKRMVEIPIDYL